MNRIFGSRVIPTRSILMAAGMLASLALRPQPTHAFGVPCPSIVDQVLRSDTVVLGRTVKEDRVETRPTQVAISYEFQIDRVLKGKLYKDGDTFAYRSDPDLHRGYLQSPLPSPEEGASFVFLSRDRDGKLQAWCALSADKLTVEKMERLIKVSADPLAYLESDREEDVCIILASLEGIFEASSPHAGNRARVVAYLKGHAAKSNRPVVNWALERLAYLEPTPPDAFDDFALALESSDPVQLMTGAAGLKRLKDQRAIPLLIERLHEIRQNGDGARRPEDSVNFAEGSVCALTDTRTGIRHFRAPESELRGVILSFDDPRVTQFVLEESESSRDWDVTAKIAEMGDERAVEILLRKTWERDSAAVHALCKLTDPRIVIEARERMYDHPQAPYLLACQGGRESKDFMLRLLRQGNGIGAKWAAQTRDPDAKADLIRGLARAGALGSDQSFFLNEAGYALGRLRAFDLLNTFPIAATHDVYEFTTIGMLLYGLADRSISDTSDCPSKEIWECLRDSLRDVAGREHWDRDQLDLANRWAAALERGPASTEYKDVYHPWTPPAGLSDMPDPLDEDAARAYFERNVAKCRAVLRSATSVERFKIMQVANHVKARVLDSDLALALLEDADRMVRSQAYSAVSDDRPALTVVEIERWALAGDGESASMALNFIRRHPKPEYRPVVTKLLYDGWHLFNPLLFEAIIETEATETAGLLRAYLEHEHITLRTNAAVTLVHLHDEAGARALPDLLRKAGGAGRGLGSRYTEAALEIIQSGRAHSNPGE